MVGLPQLWLLEDVALRDEASDEPLQPADQGPPKGHVRES